MPATRYYGCKPDRFDDRDLLAHDHLELPDASTLPARVDLRETGFLRDPVFDQGQIGSCTANAISAALMFVQRALQLPVHVTPSRLALYYWERVLEGTVNEDSGAELRDGLKVVAGRPGYVREEEWPYDTSRFTVRPSAHVQADAHKDRATRYARVAVNATAMKQVLAAGHPVVIGIDVFSGIESDEAAHTGVVPMPGPGEDPIGGHAVMLVGYDDAEQRWAFRNSWGSWGEAGYGYLPYGYPDSPNYGRDFWVITQEAEAATNGTVAPHADVVAWLEQEAGRLPEGVRAWVEHALTRLHPSQTTSTAAATTIEPQTTTSEAGS